MTEQQQIDQFLAGSPHAVVGASRDRDKYGNKVLRAYQQRERPVIPINPRDDEVEGLKAYRDLASSPMPLHGISIVTPPAVTERVVEQAARLGVKHIWMQPGAESELAVQSARQHGMNVIADGPCILVALRFRDDASDDQTER